MNRKERRAAAKKRGQVAGQSGKSASSKLEAGISHHKAGRLGDANRLYSEILSREPKHFVALHLLGVVAYRQGDAQRAAASIGKAIAIKPDYAEAHSSLGDVFKDLLGKPDEAVASYRKALAIKPDHAEAHNNLGLALQSLGRFDRAVASYHQALAIDPKLAVVHNNLGNALTDLGKLHEAAASYRKALAIAPGFAGAHNNLGNLLREMGKFDESVTSCRRALAINPTFAEAHNNLGLALKGLGKLHEAVASYRESLALRPEFAETHNNLGGGLKSLGQLDEAVANYRKALALRPDYTMAHCNLIFCMNYGERYSQHDIFAESRRWEAAHATPGTTWDASTARNRDPERRLRIGYVSPDFRRHSVSYFIDPLISGHDRDRFEVFCYAQVVNPDDETRRLRGLADSWCSTLGMTTQAMVQRVRADEIDILVDLAGHTARNRLLVFAEHPAPLQVSYLGYPNTTGLSAMDYRLTDDIADPAGPGDALYSETLARLPNGFLCFAPDADAPSVANPPALANRHVTFGSFNNLSKVTAATVAAWARILEGAPESRLLLKDRSLVDDEIRRRYRTRFAEMGIDGGRLEFCAWSDSQSGHLGAYDRIDIGLDPFPYNGTTTTCDALWMGVPVISLRGDRHASRVGASILTRVGLTELIADTVDDYVTAAVALAKAPDRIVDLRRDLRATMAASPLCDAAGFTQGMEAAYRGMWHRWCRSA